MTILLSVEWPATAELNEVLLNLLRREPTVNDVRDPVPAAENLGNVWVPRKGASGRRAAERVRSSTALPPRIRVVSALHKRVSQTPPRIPYQASARPPSMRTAFPSKKFPLVTVGPRGIEPRTRGLKAPGSLVRSTTTWALVPGAAGLPVLDEIAEFLA